ncbi:B30.2/SPRY domain-containing protein [Raphanus sativus]|nr:B30.2/SPRY domain-containing protein [Raphanus sativus]
MPSYRRQDWDSYIGIAGVMENTILRSEKFHLIKYPSRDDCFLVSYEGRLALMLSSNGCSGQSLTITAANSTTTSTYTTGDIVDCGIDYVSQEFFFTKNGSLVGTSPNVFKGVLYPTVALHSENEEVTVNFEPETFLFDLVGYKTSIKEKLNVEIDKISLSPSVPLDLVKSYLTQYGYQNTLHALGGPVPDPDNHPPDPDNHPPHPPSDLEVVLRPLRASSYFCRQ